MNAPWRLPPGARPRLAGRVVRVAGCVAAVMGLSLGPCGARADPQVRHRASDESNEVAYLVRAGTADSLATASLLSYLTQGSNSDPMKLMERALAKAPERPELVWLQLRECQQRACADEAAIAERLHIVDSDNALGWLPNLKAAEYQSAEEVTQVVVTMSDKPKPTLYWNRLIVMMYDSLTHHDRAHPGTAITLHADDRLSHVIGVLAAVDIPAFHPLRVACSSDQFENTGRRAACDKLMVALENSDAVITQNFSVVLREGWWSASGHEYEALRSKRRQQRYLMVQAGRVREGHADSDADARVGAMRQLSTEEQVEVATLRSYNEPVVAPADWTSPERED